ncbi:hypothetical protein DEDE109153_07770 [Deinococcus deserti]|nr:hypothetical protein [Deinococcus deserti]
MTELIPFRFRDVNGEADFWNCSPDEKALTASCPASVTHDEYNWRRQVSDALALQGGFCLLIKRCVAGVGKRRFYPLEF